MVVTAAVVALTEFLGRKTDTTPTEGCVGLDGCFRYQTGYPILVATGGMTLIGIILRLLEIPNRARLARVLFPLGLLCVACVHWARYLQNPGTGTPQTLFPSTFEWMAADDLILAAVAAFAAFMTEPGRPASVSTRFVVRIPVGLLVLAGLWSVLIVVHGDSLHG